MIIRLEKIDPVLRQYRSYTMRICQTLFGEWCVIREWGRIGSAGGQRLTEYLETEAAAEEAARKLFRQKCRRGYVPCIQGSTMA